jgi:hypothetical protein
MKIIAIAVLVASTGLLSAACSRQEETPAPYTPYTPTRANSAPNAEVEAARVRGEYEAEMSARISQIDDRIARVEQMRTGGTLQVSEADMKHIYALRNNLKDAREKIQMSGSDGWSAATASFESAYRDTWNAVDKQLKER